MIKTLLIIPLLVSPTAHEFKAGDVHFTAKAYHLVHKDTKKHEITQKDIDRYVHNAALKYHVDEKLVHAVIVTESTYRTTAVSKKGAVGLMQLMPATAKRFGVEDRNNVKDNIYGGVKFLRFLLDTFKGNTKLALAGYNAGEHAVMRHNNKIPPYPETINYVGLVMTAYNKNG
jgi:soluble lytic murein transglycosylase-like protein